MALTASLARAGVSPAVTQEALAVMGSVAGSEDQVAESGGAWGHHTRVASEPISRTPTGTFISLGPRLDLTTAITPTLIKEFGASQSEHNHAVPQSDVLAVALCCSTVQLLEAALPGLVEAGKAVESMRQLGSDAALDELPKAIQMVKEAHRLLSLRLQPSAWFIPS